MRTPALLLTLPLAAVLAGCGGGGSNSAGSSPTPSPSPTASPSDATCTPTGTGTTDLTKKPVVPAHPGPAPIETMTYDIVCGTGDLAKNGDNVQVKYVGVLYADGKEFDASWNTSPSYTFGFQVGSQNVIPGFSKGAEGMRVGGRREVVVPAKDGYGAQGRGPIPANAVLIFVLDLVKIG